MAAVPDVPDKRSSQGSGTQAPLLSAQIHCTISLRLAGCSIRRLMRIVSQELSFEQTTYHIRTMSGVRTTSSTTASSSKSSENRPNYLAWFSYHSESVPIIEWGWNISRKHAVTWYSIFAQSWINLAYNTMIGWSIKGVLHCPHTWALVRLCHQGFPFLETTWPRKWYMQLRLGKPKQRPIPVS
jgi:hypothetical protein